MPNQKVEEMSVFEKMDLIRILSVFPAITVMVFLRQKIGFRLMKPVWLLVMMILMLVFCALVPDGAKPFRALLIVYALGMFGLGIRQRWKRWKEIRKGHLWHSYSPGVSYIEALKFPDFMRFGRRINRFVEPPLVILAGFIIASFLCHGLGLWIMFAGFFLFIYEQNLFEKGLAHDLDMMDGLIASKAQGETASFFEQNPEGQPRTLEETEGIPTGLAPDIHRQIELRRVRQTAKTPPDNLAEEAPDQS